MMHTASTCGRENGVHLYVHNAQHLGARFDHHTHRTGVYPMGELLGYQRISTKDQKFDLQRDALLAAGVPERYLYEDTASGAQQARPGLAACLKALHPGDTLVVWKLDRVARSLLHLLEVVQDFAERQITFRVLEGLGSHLEPHTPEGKLFFSMLGAFAEFERTLIRERVIAGLRAARARGHKGGRREKLSPAQQRQARMMQEGKMSITEIAQTLGCARKTVYKALAQAPVVGG
jgi:DNA invertase Pin-like site-specific DNA recombinase